MTFEVINVHNRIIYQYTPEKFNKNVNPRVLKMIMYNNHCIKMNANIDEFNKLKEKLIDNEFEN